MDFKPMTRKQREAIEDALMDTQNRNYVDETMAYNDSKRRRGGEFDPTYFSTPVGGVILELDLTHV